VIYRLRKGLDGESAIGTNDKNRRAADYER
jgi:hypothetical protein